MLTNEFKNILKEYGSLYTLGHYPTTDEADSIPVVSENSEWGCMLELSDGVVVDCSVTQLTEDTIYGSFHSDGASAEVFELNNKNTNRFFNEFKKRIEEKYEQKLIDEDKAKKIFKDYINKIFI